MNALAISLEPIPFGWAVRLTNGHELARFRGLAARGRALRYLRTALEVGFRPTQAPRAE